MKILCNFLQKKYHNKSQLQKNFHIQQTLQIIHTQTDDKYEFNFWSTTFHSLNIFQNESIDGNRFEFSTIIYFFDFFIQKTKIFNFFRFIKWPAVF